MKILVVDDELVSRKKMQKIMESIGESESVDNGADAVSIFKEAFEGNQSFDLISLDISMPDMSGIEVLTSIREFEHEKEIKREDLVKIMMVSII